MEPDGICHISRFTFVLTLNHLVPNCTVIGQIRLVFSDAWKNHVEHTLTSIFTFRYLNKAALPKNRILVFGDICSVLTV